MWPVGTVYVKLWRWKKKQFLKHLLRIPTLRGCSSENPPRYTFKVQASYLIWLSYITSRFCPSGFPADLTYAFLTSNSIAHLGYHSHHKRRKGKPGKRSSSFFFPEWLRIASTEHKLGGLHTEGRIIYPNDRGRYNGFIWHRTGTRGRLLGTCSFGFNKGKKYID